MSEATRTLLRQSLLAGYADLKARLTRRLGSPDLADEALHETWLRLGKAGEIADVTNPAAYLYRAVLNTAFNLRLKSKRHLHDAEVDALLNFEDDAPDPERTAFARQELGRLEKALTELSPRQRAIFQETFNQGTPQPELAQRFGVGLRTVQADLQFAIKHCARRLGRKSFFVSGPPNLSEK